MDTNNATLCWRCGQSSTQLGKYCPRCGQPLAVDHLDAAQLLQPRESSASKKPAAEPASPAPALPGASDEQGPGSTGAPAGAAEPTRLESWVGSPAFHRQWSQFWRIVYKQQSKRRTLSVEDYLATVPLFEELTRGERRKLASIAHQREYAPGEVIYESGTPCVALFVIRAGAVNLGLPDGAGGETEIVRLGEGMFFDEIALHSEVPNWATARSTAETVLLAIPSADIQRLAAVYPAIGYKILSKLTAILNLRLQLMAQMTFGNSA